MYNVLGKERRNIKVENEYYDYKVLSNSQGFKTLEYSHMTLDTFNGRKHGYMNFWLPADTNIYEGYAIYCNDVRVYTEPEVEYYFENT